MKRAAGKAISLMLAIVMTLAMCVTVFAAGAGSITIDNAATGKTYNIYKVFDLETDNDSEPSAYKYTLSSKWAGLETNDDFLTYFTVDATDKHLTQKDNFDAEAFAAFLSTYRETNSIANDGSATATSATVSFTGLDMGYYLVDTTLGSVCSLDTTTPAANIEEKNAAPTLVKEVQEDSTEDFGAVNDADTNQVVTFKTTITALDGDPTDYVMHDTMSGLTFDSATGITSITVNGTAIGTTTSETDPYYALNASTSDDHTFDISFYNIDPSDVIIVNYQATVSSSATIGENGNTNSAYLSYTHDSKTETTETDTTTTYTWSMPINKYTTDDGNGGTLATAKGLADADFVLYKTVDGTKYYAQITDGKITGWTTTEADASTITSGSDGKVTVSGLDADTYYLEETDAPNGYNKLADPITVVITSTQPSGTETLTSAMTQGGSEATTISVENNTGSELPSTGGIGTTIFYIVGGILVAGAVVVLVTRRRMNGAN